MNTSPVSGRQPAPHGTAAPAVQLSAGLSTGRRVAAAVLTASSVLVLLPLGVVVGAALAKFGGVLAIIGPLLVGVLGAVLLFAVVWGVLRAVRAGASLHRTELAVRGAFRTHRVDLATAQWVRLTDVGGASPVPTLDASGDARGRSATVHFGRARAGYLPLPEVQALAAAIQADTRTGLPARHAEHTVGQLYLRAYSVDPH